MKNHRYVGAGGQQFLSQRSSAASDHVQNLRSTLFHDIAHPDARIVDFGCGTGGILERLPAADRVGVEVSEAAAEIARQAGIRVVSCLDHLPDRAFDVAISFHALEHIDCPLEALVGIGRLVTPEGRIRLVVPCEMPIARQHRSWTENDYQHLYTWTPLHFGNLAKRAGYRDIRARLVAMPTGSRFVSALKRFPALQGFVRCTMSVRRNNFNVILDARSPLDQRVG